METASTNKKEILSHYMNHVLEYGEQPKSIYAFTKALGIDEKVFYEHYNSFEAIAQNVYTAFYEETMLLIANDESYKQLDIKNKLLVFYYTFFELLTANRSYVILTLKDNKNILEKMKTFKPLRNKFKEFIKSLEIEKIDFKQAEVNKISEKSLEEITWGQLLFTLKFWLEDTSPSFEKTDIFIEKSVNASLYLFDTKPLNSLIDFGKFFFKEKIKPSL